ncbi:YraN family protein [Rhodospirillum centenum]|uniref:UPF0102 protein RC1_3037 n=1 Tax=Rhodospirillum centenum (strain ATCC 51521 / SW) TaxID=414684 RepID=B6IVS9_RHOCS|nr:YraN family protein [Rhodospirillum centenum]ACJ00403.1 conserved hypothetical protein [Rhodospirillum centenum SW]
MAPVRSRTDYRTAERLGRRAEWLCRLALLLKGYRILATRLRTPAGEVDILAERRGLLAVVEVKARPGLEAARAAVTEADWRRIARAAQGYAAARPRLAGHAIRYDLMVVLPGRWPVHLEDVRRSGR